jgi:hypothetical protein
MENSDLKGVGIVTLAEGTPLRFSGAGYAAASSAMSALLPATLSEEQGTPKDTS